MHNEAQAFVAALAHVASGDSIAACVLNPHQVHLSLRAVTPLDHTAHYTARYHSAGPHSTSHWAQSLRWTTQHLALGTLSHH